MIIALRLNDEQVLSCLRQGGKKEDRAINQLLKEHGGKVKGFIMNHGGSQEDAEEVFYDALTAFVFNVREGKFQQESAIGTYLFGIAKRLWYKRFERNMNQRTHLEKYKEWNDESIHVDDFSAVQESTRDYIDGVLNRLQDKCREVLLLWAQHFNMEEIATQLGFKNAQNAMNKKSKCLKQLAQLLDAEPELRASLSELRFA